MASEPAAGCTEDLAPRGADETGSQVKQALQDIEDRLVYLSERIALCKMVRNDLKDLRGALERKSLQNASLPLQK